MSVSSCRLCSWKTLFAIAAIGWTTGCARVTALAAPFGPGTISLGTPNSAYLGSFTPDGREFYFFRKTSEDPAEEHYRIFVSRREGERWSTADTVWLGQSPSDLYPAIDPTGRHLVFSSYRRAPGDTSAHPSASIWIATRTEGGWGPPEFVAALAHPGAYHSWLYFLSDGRLRFRRSTADYRTSLGEYAAHLHNGVFTAPARDDYTEGLRRSLAPLWIYDARPCPEADCAVVAAAQQRGAPADLYVVRSERGRWMQPKLLGREVNTDGFENFQTFTPDGHTLVFVRNFREFLFVPIRVLR